jgi:hypothetical protein
MTACPKSLPAGTIVLSPLKLLILHALCKVMQRSPVEQVKSAFRRAVARDRPTPRKTLSAGWRFRRKLLIAHGRFDFQLGKKRRGLSRTLTPRI